jgi:SAM-dependent methyltransferase
MGGTVQTGWWDGRPDTEATLSIISEFYDLDLEGYVDDINMYENFARRGELPSLELGVGTGRIAVPLARARLPVWGIDSSESMLKLAREKAGPAPSERLRLIHSDMRSFNLGRQFDLVYCALGGFLHLESQDDQIATLVRAREHLSDGGVLVIDLPNPLTLDWEAGTRPIVLDWTRAHPQRGTTVSKLVAVEVLQPDQVQRITYWFDEVMGDGALHRTAGTFNLRYVFPAEARLLLDAAGLRFSAVYGTYDLSPFDADSPRMIVVATKE